MPTTGATEQLGVGGCGLFFTAPATAAADSQQLAAGCPTSYWPRRRPQIKLMQPPL